MNQEVSPRLLHLRRKNRYLLEQLETNSVLLENRLKKLRKEARTPHLSATSGKELYTPLSKKKYDAWETRNNSEQVASALNCTLLHEEPDENVSDEATVHLKDDDVKRLRAGGSWINTPNKKPRRPVMVLSGHKKLKSYRSNRMPQKKHKQTPPSIKKRLYKPCPQCYCPGRIVSEESDLDCSFLAGGSIIHKCNKNCIGKRQRCKKRTIGKVMVRRHKPAQPQDSENKRKHRSGVDTELKSLQDAKNLIDYSPESLFLRRLRRRSHSVRNCRPLLSREGENSELDISPYDQAELFYENGHFSPSARSQPEKIFTGECHCRKPSPIKCTDYSVGCMCSQSPRSSPRKIPCPDCHRMKERAVSEDIKSQPRSCMCTYTKTHCPCTKMKDSNDPMIADFESYSSLREPCPHSASKRQKIHDGGEQLRVGDLGKFRQNNWFDCHADRPKWHSRNPNAAFTHRCAYHYFVNNRNTLEPVIPNGKGGSRCVECLLPEAAPHSPSPEDLPPFDSTEVTLPVLKKTREGCGLTARLGDEENVRKTQNGKQELYNDEVNGEAMCSAQNQLYCEAYGGSINSEHERTQNRNLPQRFHVKTNSRLRGGMDSEVAANYCYGDVAALNDTKMNFNKRAQNLKCSSTQTYSSPIENDLRKVYRRVAANSEHKASVTRLDKAPSRAPRLRKSVTAVSVPMPKTGSSLLGAIPSRSTAGRETVTIGSSLPVRPVKPPAPTNSLALRFQKGVN